VTSRVNSAEGGSNGTTVTIANSGGSSGNAWDHLGIPTGAFTFATAALQKGSLGYRMAPGSATTLGPYVGWNLTGWPLFRGRFYIRFSARPRRAPGSRTSRTRATQSTCRS
jgi:hypothetical protein